jgi:cystathionine beta-lyase/cystathionine gamma-synthase
MTAGDPDTLLAHDPDAFPDHAVVPPIVQSSLFTFPTYEAMRAAFAGELRHPVYSRVGNPTTAFFEAKMVALEGAEAARGFASGMAAISGAVLSVVRAGDRVVCVRHVYPDAYRFFEVMLPRLGVSVEYVDGGDPEAVARALPGARLLYLESPTSWVFETQDLEALTALARAHDALTVLDNSWATPVFQNPLRHGVDLVLHSASKYLSGHSDTVAGVVCGRRELLDAMQRTVVPYLGAKLAPFEAWLLVRGLRTLAVRMRSQEERGLAVARRLAEHPRVERVLHPALLGRVDGRQLRGSSSLFSVELDGAVDVRRFCDALRLFRLGVSWGGHESLVVPAAVALEQAAGPNSVHDFGVGPRVVRLHVGLERVEDLVADLEGALATAVR